MDILTAVLVVGGLGLGCSIMLVLAAKFMAVPSDETALKVEEVLPKANCGACGFAGCSDYAAAVARGDAPANMCVPGGEEVAKKVAEIMGTDAGTIEKKIAVVICRGNDAATSDKYIYRGIDSCAAANLLYSGQSGCSYGCLGLGDCVRECKFDAIFVENGLANADPVLCTGCGACAAVCPKSVIKMVPLSKRSIVQCRSHNKGAVTHKLCTNGCIACGKCVKNCPQNAITIVDNLAVIDLSLCTACGKCREVCPVKACRSIATAGAEK